MSESKGVGLVGATYANLPGPGPEILIAILIVIFLLGMSIGSRCVEEPATIELENIYVRPLEE